MDRLIFFVDRSGIIDVGQLVEGVLLVFFRLNPKSIGDMIVVIPGYFLHFLVPGSPAPWIDQTAATRQELHRRMEHADPQTLIVRLMTLSHFPQFLFDPTL